MERSTQPASWLRLSLHREALERLTARAIAQQRKLETLIQELPEHAAEEE